MANAEKKKVKIAERIKSLEEGLRLSLQKKASSAAEIDMPGTLAQIAQLKKQLLEL